MVCLGPGRIKSTGTAGRMRRVVSRLGAVYSGADGEADLSDHLRSRPIETRLRDHTEREPEDHFKFEKNLLGGKLVPRQPFIRTESGKYILRVTGFLAITPKPKTLGLMTKTLRLYIKKLTLWWVVGYLVVGMVCQSAEGVGLDPAGALCELWCLFCCNSHSNAVFIFCPNS